MSNSNQLNSIAATLTAARALIASPENWTIEVMARTVDDEYVSIGNALACKFCSMGAIRRAQWGITADFHHAWDSPAFLYLKNTLIRVHNYNNIPHFNDTHTHAEVIALFDAAIESATEQGV